MCLYPIEAWTSNIPNPHTGKMRVMLRSHIGDAPKDEFGFLDRQITLPCRKCVECLGDKSREWSNRLLLESKYHDPSQCWFITLTYDDLNLPLVKNTEHIIDVFDISTGEASDSVDGKINYAAPGSVLTSSLVKKDLAKFIEKVREKSGVNITYFACGEYGAVTNSWRAHYHLCVFGLPLNDLVFYRHGVDYNMYTSEFLSECWEDKGFVVVEPFCAETASYTAGYVMKKIGKKVETYVKYNKVPPFISYSPRIAYRYYDEHKHELINGANIYLPNGQTISHLPYFDRLLEKEFPEEFPLLKMKRRDIASLFHDADEPPLYMTFDDRMFKAALKQRKLKGRFVGSI